MSYAIGTCMSTSNFADFSQLYNSFVYARKVRQNTWSITYLKTSLNTDRLKLPVHFTWNMKQLKKLRTPINRFESCTFVPFTGRKYRSCRDGEMVFFPVFFHQMDERSRFRLHFLFLNALFVSTSWQFANSRFHNNTLHGRLLASYNV